MIKRSYNTLEERLRRIAESGPFKLDTIGGFIADKETYNMFTLTLGTPGPGKANVMLAAGIHGDEPAGVEAALRFIETRADDDLLSRFHIVVFPCDNPTGWEKNTRENWEGLDLNRQFLAPNPAQEVKIITKTLAGRCFDFVFEMHEDVDSHGFYLYEIADDADFRTGQNIADAVKAAGYPVNMNNEIEGLPAEGGIIHVTPDIQNYRKTCLPQAIYTYRTCGGHVITLEPPAAVLPLEDRVRIELMALDITLKKHL